MEEIDAQILYCHRLVVLAFECTIIKDADAAKEVPVNIVKTERDFKV